MTPVIDGLPEKVQQHIRDRCWLIRGWTRDGNHEVAGAAREFLNRYLKMIHDGCGVRVPDAEIQELLHPKGEDHAHED